MLARLRQLTGLFSLRLQDIWVALRDPGRGAVEAAAIASGARQNATVVWLVGKVQSGKTSIVRALTSYTDAEIGNGYTPCTRTSRVFDFPADAPVIRFLDTRGLGETRYDPGEDLAFAERQSHLLLVVMRALDPQQETIVDVIKDVRRRRPSWPVIVAQTSLHDAYPRGAGHPEPYPFDTGNEVAAGVPADLLRSLAYQRSLFSELPGGGLVKFVPLDFTLPEDGYVPTHYGLGQLAEALSEAAPAGLVAALEEITSAANDARSARAHPHIVGYASAAAAADAVPLAGLVAVPGVQAKMLHALASIYGIDWDRRTLTEFASGLGTTTIIKVVSHLALRQLSKLIPIYGQTVGALAASAASFATTFALGKAACYFLARRRAGESDAKGVAQVYRAALAEALKIVTKSPVNEPAA
jgi:uncharacterized protein (DUF697 family)